MSRQSKLRSAASRSGRRRGTSTLEAIVAFTLLSSVLAVATPLVVRHGLLLSSGHEYQLALEELDNQLDRLTTLPEPELAEALAQLTPSKWATAALPGAEIHGELNAAPMGRRLTLQLAWDSPQGRTKPVGLTAWIYPSGEKPAQTRTEGQP